jgi:uncharacterized short protein YbdD (DUF466 family)
MQTEKPLPGAEEETSMASNSVQPADATSGARVLHWARLARRACGSVFGVPDYDAYREHMTTTHPGEPPLARGEFLAWALQRKHAGRGPRCC